MSKKPGKKKPSPEHLAIIICESVIEDARTHNKSILNAFNRITVGAFPAQQNRMTIFLSLTSGHGDTPVEVTFGRMGKKPMLKLEAVVKFRSPRVIAELVLELRQVPIPEPGEYVVQVLDGEGSILCQRRIEARQTPGAKG